MFDRSSQRRGNTVIEFTLVGIPVIFLLISIFEISRGMWTYHTLAAAVRDGVRFAAVHGNNCTLAPSNCAVRISDVAGRIRDYAVGISPAEIENVSFISRTRTVSCATLADCLNGSGAGAAYWPSAGPGASLDPGGDSMMGWVEIRASYNFRSAIAMLWPGAGAVSFGAFQLPASSHETIQH